MKFYYSLNQLKCAVRFILKNNKEVSYNEEYLQEIVYCWLRDIANILREENKNSYIFRKWGFVIYCYKKPQLEQHITYDFQILVEPNIKVGGEYTLL